MADNGCTGACCADFWLQDETLFDPLPGALVSLGRSGVEGRHYTCAFWDPLSTLCTVYERRPPVCRDYGATCAQPGCGFAAREDAP